MLLPEIKKQTESLALNDLSEALEFFRENLPADSPVIDTVLAMIRRLNRMNTNRRKGLISLEDMEIIENQIFESLLQLLRSLDEEKVATGSARIDGKILYDIPNQMALGKEERCRIRLAFLEEIIKENLEWADHMEIHPIQIGEVMSVEIVDPSAQPVFSIRSISDEVQRIDPDFYSEWWFYITALREGQFTLLLRVSIVEVVDGVDRKRNIVLEEVIDIVKVIPIDQASQFEFKESDQLLSSLQSTDSKIDVSEEVIDPAAEVPNNKGFFPPPPPPSVTPAPPAESSKKTKPKPGNRSKPEAPRSKARRRWMTYAAGILVVVGSVSYAMVPNIRSEINWWRTGDSQSEYVEYIKENPGSPRAIDALEGLDANRMNAESESEIQSLVRDTILPQLEGTNQEVNFKKKLKDMGWLE